MWDEVRVGRRREVETRFLMWEDIHLTASILPPTTPRTPHTNSTLRIYKVTSMRDHELYALHAFCMETWRCNVMTLGNCTNNIWCKGKRISHTSLWIWLFKKYYRISWCVIGRKRQPIHLSTIFNGCWHLKYHLNQSSFGWATVYIANKCCRDQTSRKTEVLQIYCRFAKVL